MLLCLMALIEMSIKRSVLREVMTFCQHQSAQPFAHGVHVFI